MGVAVEFLLKLGNHKPCRFDCHVVCTANNGTCQSNYHRGKFLGQKEGTDKGVSVAKLLRLSIHVLQY